MYMLLLAGAHRRAFGKCQRRPQHPIFGRRLLSTNRSLDHGDVDLLHRHHRVERPLGGGAIGAGKRLGQRDRRDLPGDAPLVLAPTALALLTAVVDDRVPVSIGLGLIVRGNLERERLTRYL
jgi:hypothetical protein